MSSEFRCLFCDHVFSGRRRKFCTDCLPDYADVHRKAYHRTYQLLWMATRPGDGPTSKLGKQFKPSRPRQPAQPRPDCKDCGTTEGMDWWVGRHALVQGKRPTAGARCQRCYNAMIAARYKRRVGTATPYRPADPRQLTAIRAWREERDRATRLLTTRECSECHSFFHPWGEHRYNAERCAWCTDEFSEQSQGIARSRRREVERAGDDGITWQALIRLGGQTCHLCGDEVKYVAGTAHEPRGATVDHITPIARGGSHTWDNVALAHRSCNISRGAKPLAA